MNKAMKSNSTDPLNSAICPKELKNSVSVFVSSKFPFLMLKGKVSFTKVFE